MNSQPTDKQLNGNDHKDLAGLSPLHLTRRGLIAALSGLAAACGTAASRLKEPLAWGEESVYTRWLGLRPFLSCQGHNTVIGGSRMPAEVMRAMLEANDYFIDMHALNKAAGDYVAGVMEAEAALVSAGSFSAMVLGAAACLTGTDQEKIEALPHPTWDKVECLTQTQQRFNYDRAYRAAGMKIVESDTKQGFIDKISDKTPCSSRRVHFSVRTRACASRRGRRNRTPGCLATVTAAPRSPRRRTAPERVRSGPECRMG